MKNTNISKKIIKWYDNNKRILPWRADISNKKKEYFTLVSEFMLQQTQVKTVIPYFNNFILKIPDLESLSKIRNEKLMKCWEGLGYYSRARNLKKTAKKILKEFKGNLPNNEDDLKTLPGIGDYTSKAIMAIAFNKKIIPLDGNVERILKRVLYLKKDHEISKENLHRNKLFFGESKRAGDYILIQDLLKEVTSDVIRFVMLSRNNDIPLDFDIDLMLSKSKDNPVFYVNYAHARIVSVFKRAEELNMWPLTKMENLEKMNLPYMESELALVKKLSEWPNVVKQSARYHEPHRIVYYLNEVASSFHSLCFIYVCEYIEK